MIADEKSRLEAASEAINEILLEYDVIFVDDDGEPLEEFALAAYVEGTAVFH